VEFENPTNIMLHVKRRSFYYVGTAPTPEFFAKKIHDIKVGDADFDGKFQVRGNDEALVRSILDSSFRDEMMRTRNILSPRRNIEVGYISPMPTPFPTWGVSSIPDLFRYREEYNIAHYIDPRKLSRVEEDADRIRAILDIMIYIVERIETNKPS
jgi:hypothetical protein